MDYVLPVLNAAALVAAAVVVRATGLEIIRLRERIKLLVKALEAIHHLGPKTLSPGVHDALTGVITDAKKDLPS